MPLGKIAQQQDFSAGMFRSLAPHNIPSNGVYDLTDMLIDNEGLPYQRGGIEALSNAFSSSDLVFVYDGLFESGRRTMFATKTEFGALDADGVTPITLYNGYGMSGPGRGFAIGGRLYIDGGHVYAGARKGGGYPMTPPRAGTASLTQGATTIIGSGTAFLTDAGPGMLFGFSAGGARNYVIKSVTDDTHLEITQAAMETSSGTYDIGGMGIPNTLIGSSEMYGVAGRRLLAVFGDKIRFSRNVTKPTALLTAGSGGSPSFAGLAVVPDEDPEHFEDTDYHQIPHAPGLLGLDSWGTTAVVFTTDGVWLITNMDLQPVDNDGNVQQSLTHLAPQIVLWHRNGIASFQDTLVVPARDAVYLLGQNTLERLDAPITPLYRSYHRAGYTLGRATVFEGHYFLPVLEPSTFDQVDTLVCRLDRPVWQGRHMPWIYPWGHFSGLPIRGYAAQETADAPNLLVASTGNKVLRARYFEPDQTEAQDIGTTFESSLTTRDYPTGNGNQNLVREVQADYDLIDTATPSNPEMIVEWSTTHPVETAPFTTETERGPEGADSFKRWLLPDPQRSRYIRIRLRPSAKLKTLLIRSLAILGRQSTKND